MHNRNDLGTARLIERALKEGRSRSRIDTAWELVEKGVPVGVAVRVVARPADRRPRGMEPAGCAGWQRQQPPQQIAPSLFRSSSWSMP